MGYRRTFCIFGFWLAVSLFCPSNGEAQEDPPPGSQSPESISEQDVEAELYLTKCSGCHTIGHGKLSGPDLEKSAKWPEADLAVAIKRMEEKSGPLPTEEIEALIRFMKSENVQSRITVQQQKIAQKFAATLDAPSAAMGEALFAGGTRLLNGGMHCSACHVAAGNGGNLAPDLSVIFTQTGLLGLVSASEQANFPVMKTAYRDHPVTKQEAIHIAEYLKQVSEEAPSEAAGGSKELWLGVVAALLILAGIGAYGHADRPAGTRARLVRNANRSQA